MRDEEYMKLAIRLASRGMEKASPNPVVGAVIVKDGRIIGKGYHRYFGGNHAEVNAIRSAGEELRGATMYVTLEPCSHYGKTPPCVDVIINQRLGRVVIGSLDPNPQVKGKGVKKLKQQGIETEVGILEEECRSLNEAHFKLMICGRPLVTVKFAQTLDGRIATVTGDSKWISSSESRKLAHKLRKRSDAVMVGVGTILKDDPELTVRLVKGRNPARVILDSALRIPLEAKVLAGQRKAATIIATTAKAEGDKLSQLRNMGIEVLIVPEDEQDGVNLWHLLELLGQRGISSVLVEGGAGVITSLLKLRLADKLVVFIAPKIMGKGIEAVGELGVKDVEQALPLSFSKVSRVGEDLVIEARLQT
ncbi:bifunctional diaminohydroxyphosphoribosylaminopyrimidine deaminase/5-amino-6-(5-phosphoribosylamino)uracil reductase RibD [Chloroflexota bacterium]